MLNKTNTVFDEKAYRYLHNSLNEVLHGIWLSVELERRVSSLRAPMSALLKEMKQNRSQPVLSTEQALLLIESCNICEEEFEGSEFEARLGYSRAEAKQVIAELSQITCQAVRQPHAAAS